MKSFCRREIVMALAALVGLFAENFALARLDGGALGPPVWTNGQIQFTLKGESGVSYVIEHSADLQHWTPVLTNSDLGFNRLITTEAPDSAGFYRASRSPMFVAAIAAVSTINLYGNNITTDGFDSGDPNYADPYGHYHPALTKASGDVCTGASFVDSLVVGNARIKGNLRIGPGATNTIQMGPNGSVGDLAWVDGGSTGIQPGHSATDFNVVFPDVTLPTQVWPSATTTTPGSDIIDGVQYSYIFKTNGDYSINTLNGSIYVSTNAHVRLRINNNFVTSSKVIRINANNAYLQIFMLGDTFSLGGGAWIDNMSGLAYRFFLFGLPTCTSITFGGNGNFYGGIYAPQATFNLGGGGSDTWDFVGASVTKTVTMYGHFDFHFDENLARVGPVR